jgi:hypothetical protein
VDGGTSSTADGTSASKLIDSGADFVTDGVQVGDTILNTTDTTETTVTAIDSATQLSLADDIFVSGEAYTVYIAKSRWHAFVNLDRAAMRGTHPFCNSGDQERYGLAWVNGRGGWDFFNFEKTTELEWTVRSKYYRKAITEQGQPWESDHLRPTQMEAERKWNLHARWVQQKEQEFLRFLFHSPQVILIRYDGSPTFTPVVVENKRFKYATARRGKIKDFKITVKIASQELIQNR